MIFLIITLLVLLGLCFLILFRNELVYRSHIKAIDWAFSGSNIRQRMRKVDSCNYIKHLFDFRKWTFEQFFPFCAHGDDGEK